MTRAAPTSEPCQLTALAALELDDFQLFGLPRRQALSRAEIDKRWHALQAQVHPDRFATGDAAVRHLALQCALRVNEAYQCLKDPVSRAAALCRLHGMDATNDCAPLPRSLLMQQMDWREALEAATGPEALLSLSDEVAARREGLLTELARHIDDHQDWGAAARCVQEAQFISRLAADVAARMEA